MMMTISCQLLPIHTLQMFLKLPYLLQHPFVILPMADVITTVFTMPQTLHGNTLVIVSTVINSLTMAKNVS